MRFELVINLYGHQPAETILQHEDGNEPERDAGGADEDTEPAHGVSVDGPEADAVGIRREIGHQERDDRKCEKDPAVALVFFPAGTQAAASREHRDDDGEKRDPRERLKRRVRKERAPSVPTPNAEAKLDGGRHETGYEYRNRGRKAP